MKKLTLILFVLSSTNVFTQTLADTASIEMNIAREFVYAMNDSDIEAMREFTLTYRTKKALARTPIEKRLRNYQSLKEKMGLLEIGPIDKYQAGSIKFYVFATETDTWFKIGFKLGEDDLLESLSIMPSRSPNKSEKVLNVKQQLQKIITDGLAPGVAMVTVRNGKIHKSYSYGIRSSLTNEQININDPFHLGSVAKSFTASLIGRLMDDGKIKMNTTLGEIFPFDMNEQYQSVTIGSVMAHEGGFPAYSEIDDEEESRLLALPGPPREQRMAFAKELLNKEPTFPPNEGMYYSNAGYAVLAAVCEHIVGKSWEKQLHDVIFKPLNMESAGVGWPTDVNFTFPEGHEANGDVQDTKTYFLGAYLEPAGDIHCSMKDLAKYAIAHMNGLNGKDDFISSSTIKMLHEIKGENTYAGGWMSEEIDGKTIYFHGGSAGTFFSYIALNPVNNSAYVIAANSGNPALLGIFREIISP